MVSSRAFFKSKSSFGVPYISNLNALNMRNYRAGLAKMRGGLSNVPIAMIGDSTTAGTQTGGGAVQYLTGYPPQLSDLLNNLNIKAGWQNRFATGGQTVTTIQSFDSRISPTGWTNGFTALCGNLFFATAAANFAFTPTVNCDTFDIWYVRSSIGGTFNVNLDGGSNTLVNTNNAGADLLMKATISGTLAGHTLNVAWASGNVIILGVDCYASATKQVSVWNFGQAGAKIADFILSTQAWDSIKAIQSMAPALCIIDLILNDASAATDITTFTNSTQTLITGCKNGGLCDVMLKTPAISSAIGAAAMAPYLAAYAQLALTNDIPLLDGYTRWGDYATMNALGMYSDTTHGSKYGYNDVAGFVRNALLAI